MFVLFNFIAAIVLFGIGAAIGSQFLYYIYVLAVFIPSLAVGVRRLHDTGRSGWMYLIGLIPFVGWIFVLVWFASEGNAEANEYGTNPKYTA